MDATYTGTLAEGISTTMYNGTQGYDKNGNIGYLKRTTGGEATVMDELIYSYAANQLTAVADGGDATKGFKDKVNTTDYAYDAAGNMTSDANKDLSIAYNHLNLPASITRTNSGTHNGVIKHYYAGATKVRMETYDAAGTTLVKAYDYLAGMVYITTPLSWGEGPGVRSELDFVASSEGRAILTKKVLGLTEDPTTGDKFRFEYSLKDHLGNLRVSCRCGEPKRDAQGIIIPEGQLGAGIEQLAVVQEQHYEAWGLAFGAPSPVERAGGADRFTYNSKELLTDLELGWNDYGFRMYDASVGRWSAVDPLAEKNNMTSSYIYVLNNPILYIDPFGLDTLNSNSQGFNWDNVKGGDIVDGVLVFNEIVARPNFFNNISIFFSDLVDIFSGNVGSKYYGTGNVKFTEDLSVRSSNRLKKIVTNDLSNNEVMKLIDDISSLTESTPKNVSDLNTTSKLAGAKKIASFVTSIPLSGENLPRVGFGEKKLRYDPQNKTSAGGYTIWYAVIDLGDGNTRTIEVNAARYGQPGVYTEKIDKLLKYAK